ncbi:hypothetical protein DX928_23070 [Bacillus swezeyi]|uniref:Uncharacterized protein n=2 Tax=Bacillus swezeyi TaxID=1925020 RepID=A0A5M8RGB6_9BACI|nr:hypothetical protein DX927_22830 [Bacillus swezeyi]KAA6471459.1 hypothetical protein DX928_23070 [Bacillus swezeyi]
MTNEGKEKQNQQEEAAEKIKNEQEKLYESMSRPLSEVVSENEVEHLDLNTLSYKVRDKYENPEEFAAFISNAIFQYENNTLGAEDYYAFLKTYAAKSFLETLPTDKEQAVFILKQIQDQIKNQEVVFTSYEISKVEFNKNKTEAYFFRKESSNDQPKFSITTIKKEKGIWLFYQDELAPAFEANQSIEENKKGGK